VSGQFSDAEGSAMVATALEAMRDVDKGCERVVMAIEIVDTQFG
jgi:hypothetical protein